MTKRRLSGAGELNRHTWQKEARTCNGRSRNTRTRCGGWHLPTWGKGWSPVPPTWAANTPDTAEGAGRSRPHCHVGAEWQLPWKAAGQFPGAPGTPAPVSVYSGETPAPSGEVVPLALPLCSLHPDQGTASGLSAGGQMSTYDTSV